MPTALSSGIGRSKLLVLCFCVAMIGAVLSPIRQNWRQSPQDNFPLSYFPMFSAKRSAVETFYYFVGVDRHGRRHIIRHGLMDGGENQVRRQLRKIIDDGRAPELAQQVAARVAKRSGTRWTSIVSVSVCKGRYSVDDYFHGRKEPLSELVEGSADVQRTGKP